MPSPVSVFIIDPPESLDPPTDTTLALMRESCNRGHRVYYCTLDGLYLERGEPRAALRGVEFTASRELFSAGSPRERPLSDCDLLYMRKDPPVDAAYLHATHILDRLPPQVVQINPATALRNFCEKLLPLQVPGLLPESLVSRDPERLQAFLERLGHIVVKPLGECSGRGIFALAAGHGENRDLLLAATAEGTRFVQAERFLPEIEEGDKRVLLLGGEILGAVRRLPAEGDFRSNINAGGRCVACHLTDMDREICRRAGQWLADQNIHLAGIDIVGRHVLEINITSPSCLREMNELNGTALERQVIDYAEELCRRRSRAPTG